MKKIELEVCTIKEKRPNDRDRCLVSKDGCLQMLVYNDYDDCWDDSEGDDYYCDLEDDDIWMELPTMKEFIA